MSRKEIIHISVDAGVNGILSGFGHSLPALEQAINDIDYYTLVVRRGTRKQKEKSQ